MLENDDFSIFGESNIFGYENSLLKEPTLRGLFSLFHNKSYAQKQVDLYIHGILKNAYFTVKIDSFLYRNIYSGKISDQMIEQGIVTIEKEEKGVRFWPYFFTKKIIKVKCISNIAFNNDTGVPY